MLIVLLGTTGEPIDAAVASQVISENINTIMQSEISLPSFVDKLLVKRIINDIDQRSIMDSTNVLTIDDKWRKLIAIIQATIRLDPQDFLTFLNAIKDGGALREKNLANKLYKVIILYAIFDQTMFLQMYIEKVNS